MTCRCLECQLERENTGDPWLNDLTEEDFMTVSEKDAKDRQVAENAFEEWVNSIGGADSDTYHDYPVNEVFIEGFLCGTRLGNRKDGS